MLVALAILAGQPLTAGAQEGVSVETLARGMPDAGGQQLTLMRATFAPEGLLRPHRHPGPMLLYIEQGALGYTLLEGSAEIMRAAAAGSAAPPEILTPGGGTVLHVGDQLLELGVVHAALGVGEEPTVVLISALLTPGQPVTQFVQASPQP
jgi:quercetin dioxygenase-like cupin family protein